MILILCAAGDESIGRVRDELRARGEHCFVLYPERFPVHNHCTFFLETHEAPSLQLSGPGDSLPLRDVSSVWYWHPKPPDVNSDLMDLGMRELRKKEWYAYIEGIWRANGWFWLNHPGAVREAEHKPLQLMVAKKLGFLIPDTIISNDPVEISRFYTKHNTKIIQKTLQSQFFRADSGQSFPFYTKRVEREELRSQYALTLCPVIYQKNIQKLYDIRVTIVGKNIFAAEIHSQLSSVSMQDFRCYDLDNTPYYVHHLPSEIEDKCLAMLDALDLSYGAIDLIYTPDHRYIFLEINPSGQYGWIETLTGMPITNAICDLLQKGRSRSQMLNRH